MKTFQELYNSPKDFTTLYKMDSSGKIRVWIITLLSTDIIIEHGISNGKKTETIIKKLTVQESVQEYLRLIKNKIEKKGYTTTIPDKPPSLPMLAQKYKPGMDLPDTIAVQPKLDGIRCIGNNQSMTTRTGLPITSCPHTQQALNQLPPGVGLDGELYCHGVNFQNIYSAVQRDTPSELSMQMIYYVFDTVDTQNGYKQRYTDTINYASFLNTEYISPVYIIGDLKQKIDSYLEQTIAKGYEGIMIRTLDTPYEPNKRSSQLLKYKKSFDYKTNIIRIEGGTSGKADEHRAMFVVSTPNGQSTIRATPAMTKLERGQAYSLPHKYVGMEVEIRYDSKSDKGVPQKARAYLCQNSKKSSIDTGKLLGSRNRKGNSNSTPPESGGSTSVGTTKS